MDTLYIAINPECLQRMIEEQGDQVTKMWQGLLTCFIENAVLETTLSEIARISGTPIDDAQTFLNFWVKSNFIVLLAHDWQEAPPCIDGLSSIAPKSPYAQSPAQG